MSIAAIGALTALSVFGLAAPASAATISVCASGCDSTTIAGAVAAANPGDTITVAAGTYSEVVTINKADLTILGAQAGVDARGRTGGGESVISQGQFRIAANNVTIDGFSFFEARNGSDWHAGVYSQNVQGQTIVNNIFTDGMFGVQLLVIGPAPAVIAQNSFVTNNKNANGGTGIFVASGSNLTVTNNDFQGHKTAAININGSNIEVSNNYAVGDATFLVLANTTNAVVDNNTLIDGVGGSGIYLGKGNSGIAITNNLIDSAADPADGLTAIRLATDFGTDPSTDYEITGNTTSGGWAHSIRRTAGAYDGVLEAHGNNFSAVVTNHETAPENGIDATENWWAPGVDFSAMTNVDFADACEFEGCVIPAVPTHPATGSELPIAAGALAAAVLAAGGALLLLRRRMAGAAR